MPSNRQPRPAGHPPLDPDSPSRMVSLRLPEAEIARIDRARGGQTRSEWVRDVVRRALDRKRRGRGSS